MVNNINMVRPERLSICEHQHNRDPCYQQDGSSDSECCLYHHHQPTYHRERELGMGHHIFKILWNGNFSSPIEERLSAGGACVLIVGTNPSIMTFDLATAYPRSTFIGLEIFPPNPSSQPLSPTSPSTEPPNATILQTHMLASPQIPFPKECFDFVYFHSLVDPREYMGLARESARESEDWSREKGVDYELGLVKDMIRVLKPNGWIEFMRIENMCDCELGDVTKKMVNGYLEYMGASAVGTLNFKGLKSFLTSTKKLRNITGKSKETLLGVGGGRIGELLANTLLSPINSNGSSLSAFMKIPTQEFDRMYDEMMDKEINECKAYCKTYRIYSKKI